MLAGEMGSRDYQLKYMACDNPVNSVINLVAHIIAVVGNIIDTSGMFFFCNLLTA